MTERPAWLLDEPEDAYHARRSEYLTSHALADFRECPLLYRQKQLGLIHESDSTAYKVGRVAHTLILEGEATFESKYAVGGPINPKTGNPYGPTSQTFQKWAEEQPGEVIDQGTADQARLLADAVSNHPVASDLFSGGWAEGVVRVEDVEPRMMGRIDYYKPGSIIDLKTCQDLTYFQHDARRYGYLYQLAFYLALVEMAMRDPHAKIGVYMVAVEKQAPYRVGVWHIAREALASYRSGNASTVVHLKECLRNDVWPTGYEQVREWEASA